MEAFTQHLRENQGRVAIEQPARLQPASKASEVPSAYQIYYAFQTAFWKMLEENRSAEGDQSRHSREDRRLSC